MKMQSSASDNRPRIRRKQIKLPKKKLEVPNTPRSLGHFVNGLMYAQLADAPVNPFGESS
jgi:hypothetical protein